MRQFCDNTEVKLTWARVFQENKSYFIEFPETAEDLERLIKSPRYKNYTNVFTAGYKVILQYNDHRFNQKRKIKLVLGVSEYQIIIIIIIIIIIKIIDKI